MLRPGMCWPVRLVFLTVSALLVCLAAAAQASTATEPVLVKAFSPSPTGPPFGSQPSELTNVGGKLFFSLYNRAELWRSDGTSSGTTVVRDFPGEGRCAIPEELTSANGTLFFTASNSSGGRELWRSDGTAAGTFALTNLYRVCVVARVRNLTSVGDKLFFYPGGVSDGTVAGTKPLSLSEIDLTNVNGTLFFGRLDFNVCQLWKSDGTPAGTVLVKDINPNEGCRDAFDHPHGEEFPSEWVNVAGTLFFTADDGIHGVQIWKSDGTEAGTVLVKVIDHPPYYGPTGLTAVGDTLYFGATDNEYRSGLWRSDGTDVGTTPVEGISCISNATEVNGTPFFRACDKQRGAELWKSDPTGQSLSLVKDINPGSANSVPYGLINVDGVLFFVADDGIHGDELWRSDGTDGGTTLVKDLNPGPGGSNPGQLTNVNGVLFFTANDGTHSGLWRLGPLRSDYKNAAQFCKAQESFLGSAAFGRKYGTDKSGANAHGKCVSQNQ